MPARIGPEERGILESLDAALRPRAMRLVLDRIEERLRRRITDDPEAPLVWEAVPLEVYPRERMAAGGRTS